jgi:hypothetical protein
LFLVPIPAAIKTEASNLRRLIDNFHIQRVAHTVSQPIDHIAVREIGITSRALRFDPLFRLWQSRMFEPAKRIAHSNAVKGVFGSLA